MENIEYIEYNTDLKGTFLLLELIEWGQGLSLSAGTQVQVFLVTVKSLVWKFLDQFIPFPTMAKVSQDRKFGFHISTFAVDFISQTDATQAVAQQTVLV